MAIVQVGNNEWHGIKGIDKKEDILTKLSKSDLGTKYIEIDSVSGIGDIFELNVDSFGVIAWYKL